MLSTVGLVALMATPAQGDVPPKTISPDDAYSHRSKHVTVCGTVRDANLSYVGGRVYFVTKDGARVWAIGEPLALLAPRMGTLVGAQVCTHGRVYSNLEGVGVDVDDLPGSVEFVAARDITAPMPVPLAAWSPDAKPDAPKKAQKETTFDAELWAPVFSQIGELIGTALAGGYGQYPPSSAYSYAPPATPRAKNTSISDVSRDGEVITMLDGSVWEVNDLDRIHSSLWLTGRVTIVKGQRLDEYILVRDGSTRSVRARRIR